MVVVAVASSSSISILFPKKHFLRINFAYSQLNSPTSFWDSNILKLALEKRSIHCGIFSQPTYCFSSCNNNDVMFTFSDDMKVIFFTNDDKILLKVLRQGYSAKLNLKEFPHKHWSPSALDRLLHKIDSTGSLPSPFYRKWEGRGNEWKGRWKGKGKGEKGLTEGA